PWVIWRNTKSSSEICLSRPLLPSSRASCSPSNELFTSRKKIMAITDVLVPQLSESISEATLLTWKKQPGEAVEADEILIEVETDKVVLEVPAPSSGVLSEIVKSDGSTVTSGEVLARIDTEAKASAAPAPAAAAPQAEATAPAAAASAGTASASGTA